MRALRVGLVLGLLAAAAACGGDDSTTATETTTEIATETTSGTTQATSPSATTTPATTTPPTTTPATTEPAVTPTETVVTVPDATTSAPSTATPPMVDVRVYFLRDERLATVHRDVAGPAVLRGALTELLAGPTDDDAATGLVTTIPDGTALRGVNVADGTATVDLTGEFDDGGGSLSMTTRVGEIVFTATQFDGVERVVFWIDGAPIEYLGGEGLVMSEPWTRVDVGYDVSGAVIFDSPAYGSAVTSPFVVSGEGDVYEGQFPVEIRRDGAVVTTIAPVTAGAWGVWAGFSVTVELDLEPGPIEVVGFDEGGCGDAPDCPPIIETVLPLDLG